jgi:hypothetical protein
MARPRVADGGDGFQIWRVAEDILNNQSRTADKGGLPGLGLSVGLTTHHKKKLLRNVTQGFAKSGYGRQMTHTQDGGGNSV